MAIKRMDYSERLIAHGMRSIASTALNDAGFDPDLIKAALADSVGSEVSPCLILFPKILTNSSEFKM